MNCQDYQEWIEDAALGAIAGVIDHTRRAQLDAHLAACSECRREFEAAQRLYVAIDRGVAAGVEGVPSADFAERVRMRLAAESERAQLRWWRSAIWIPALGTAALALVLLTLWIARRPAGQRLQAPKQQTVQSLAPTSAPPSNMKAPEQARVTRPPATPVVPRQLSRASGAAPQNRRPEAAPDSQAPQLQVQIQPGQWAAVKSLYRAGQDGSLKDVAAAAATSEEPLQVKPVEVPPLVIAELQDPQPVGSEPESTNVQDR